MKKAILLIPILLLGACGVISRDKDDGGEAARMAANAKDSGAVTNLANNKDAIAKWNKMYPPKGGKNAVDAKSVDTSLLGNANQALLAAQNASKKAGSRAGGKKVVGRNSIATTLTLTIPPLLNTYYPQYSIVNMLGGAVGYYGMGVVAAEYHNDPATGYVLYTGIPFIYPYPTYIPALALLGVIEASGNGLAPTGAIAAAYADYYATYWGIAGPGIGYKSCYWVYGYPYPYCVDIPPAQ